MAMQTFFRCPGCGFEVESWDEGNPYIEARYHTLNPAALHRDILRYQAAMGRHAARAVTSGRPRSNADNHPRKQPVSIQGARG